MQGKNNGLRRKKKKELPPVTRKKNITMISQRTTKKDLYS